MKQKKRLVANEQAFQSIYLDPKPSSWEGRIVFHDPIFEDEIPGVIALKSLEMENLIGLVVVTDSVLLIAVDCAIVCILS